MKTPPLKFLEPHRNFPSIGECIYCSEAKVPLTKEHIIPFAIGRNQVTFSKASCLKCAEIFKKGFEAYVLSKNLAPIRFKVNAPSRRQKNKADLKEVSFLKIRPGTNPIIRYETRLTRIDYPLGFIGLRLYPPRILCGVEVKTQAPVDGWSNVNIDDLRALAIQSVDKSILVGEVNPLKFAQFLGKIAFSYAVAEKGKAAFQPLILPLIFGRTEVFSDLVGGDYNIEAPSGNMHELQNFVFDTGTVKFHFVRIRLFACFGTPTYHVVVGKSI